MNPIIRKVILPLPGLVRWYLSKPRKYSYQHLHLIIKPGVFHPGLFFSTTFIADYIAELPLQGLRVIEVGCGSGLLSLVAAQHGALVTSLDISKTAVKNTLLNADRNHLSLRVIQSDLFSACSPTDVDWIFINPPYYPRSPVSEWDHAWYCGEDHTYFRRLFEQLQTSTAHIVMVLSDVCNIPMIKQIAVGFGFELREIRRKGFWADGNNYLFQIKHADAGSNATNKRIADIPG